MTPEQRRQLDADLGRLADGDRDAFAPVFERAWPVVARFCRRLLGPNESDDAAQNTLLKLFERAGQFDRERDALTWILTIAAYEARTVATRRRRSKVAGDVPLQLPADATTDPERSFARSQMQAALAEALAGLSESDRATLAAELDGRHDPQVPSATRRKRKQRALDRLRGVWRGLYGTTD